MYGTQLDTCRAAAAAALGMGSVYSIPIVPYAVRTPDDAFLLSFIVPISLCAVIAFLRVMEKAGKVSYAAAASIILCSV